MNLRMALSLLLVIGFALCGPTRAAEAPIMGEANEKRFQVALPTLVEIQRCVQEFLDPFDGEAPDLRLVVTKVVFMIPPPNEELGKATAPQEPILFQYRLRDEAGEHNFVQPYRERTKQPILLFSGSRSFYGPDIYPVLLVFTRLPKEGNETDFITLKVNGKTGKYRVSYALPDPKQPPKEQAERRDAS